jgi:hypothetical protein
MSSFAHLLVMIKATGIPFCHSSNTMTVYKGYCVKQVSVVKKEMDSSKSHL